MKWMSICAGTTVALVLNSAAWAAEPPHALDLICKGRQTEGGHRAARKWAMHYRIDTDQLKYCEDRCETLMELQKATDDALVIDAQSGGTLTISRSTGSLRQSGGELNIDARCKAAKFSGFPKARF